jgi:hypothetical protein
MSNEQFEAYVKAEVKGKEEFKWDKDMRPWIN